MKGKYLDITFIPGTKPTVVHTPIPVPHHWKKGSNKTLTKMWHWPFKNGGRTKKNGSPRHTMDLQKLNTATLRETDYMPSPFNQALLIPAYTRKTVLDAWNGYHSLPFSLSAQNATTFIIEWGRYCYHRAQQGFHASGDACTQRFDDITIDMPRQTRCIDDTRL